MTGEKAEKAGVEGQKSVQMTGENEVIAGVAGQESNNGSGGHPANSKSRRSRWDNQKPVSKSRSSRRGKQQPISKQEAQPGPVASPPDIDTAIDGAQNAAAGSTMEPKTTPAVELHKSIPKPLDPTEEGPSRDSVDAGHPKKRKLENAAPKPVELGFEILDRRSITMMDGTVRTYYSLPQSEQREPFPSGNADASSLENVRFGSRELNPGHHSHENQYALPPENPHPHGGPLDARKTDLQRLYGANPTAPPPQSGPLGYENHGSSVNGNSRQVPRDECSIPRDRYPGSVAGKCPPSMKVHHERISVPPGVPGKDPPMKIPHESISVPPGVPGPDGSAVGGYTKGNLAPREPFHGSGYKLFKRKRGRY